MSVYGEWTAATIAAGANTSAAIDLGKDYDFLNVDLPPMDSCKLYLQVSRTLGGTYRDLGKNKTTSEGSFNRQDVWRLGGHRYIKVKATKPQADSRAIMVRGMRY